MEKHLLFFAVTSRYNLTMFLIIFAISALNHACLGWKIWRRVKHLNRVSNSMHVWSITTPPVPASNKDPSLLDCKSSALFVTLLSAAAAIYLVRYAVGRDAAAEWAGVAVMALICANALLILPLSVIVRKRHLRKTIIREMQELFVS